MRAFRPMAVSLLGIAFMLGESYASETIAITVKSGPRQVFRGAGTSISGGYDGLPASTKLAIDRLVWKDLDFRVLRMWSNSRDTTGERLASGYAETIAGAKRFQPNLILLLAPGGNVRDIDGYAGGYAAQIAGAFNTYGLKVDVTGICNEPNLDGRIAIEDVPLVIRAFREQLDARGMNDVKVIAPEAGSVDDTLFRMVDAIMADTAALNAMHAWAAHSYNMGMTVEMAEHVDTTGKDYWQTESSSNGPEGPNDTAEAVKAAAHFISDVNLMTNYWLWFLGYEGYSESDNATRIISYDGRTGSFLPLLKYYYFRQIFMTIKVGSVMRNAVSDRTRKEEKYLEWQYGLKAPVYAAAGVNPDGTWGIALLNATGVDTTDWDGGEPGNWISGSAVGWGYPAETFDVTLHVEELASAAQTSFTLMRSNGSVRARIEASPVVMNNGTLTLTVKPCELLCLRNTNFADAEVPTAPSGLTVLDSTSATVTLAWTPSLDTLTGVYCYLLYGAADTTTAIDTVWGAQCTHTIEGLSEGVSGNYALRAVDRKGNASPFSSSVTATPRFEGFVVRATESAPTIDGKLEPLWDNASSVVAKSGWDPAAPDDITGTLYAQWDSTSFYVAVEVLDDTLSQDDSSNWWLDDGVEIFLDIGNDKLAEYGDDDFQFVLNPGASEAVETKHGVGGGVTMAQSRSAAGYVFEVRMPWSVLGASSVVAGTELGFDFKVRDDDDGGYIDRHPAWWGEYYVFENPSYMGTIRLADEQGAVRHVAAPVSRPFSVRVIANRLCVQGQGRYCVSLVDMSGRTLRAQRNVLHTTALSLEAIGTGVYLVRFDNGRGVQTRKILLRR